MRNLKRLCLLFFVAASFSFVSLAQDDEDVEMVNLQINKDSISEGISMLEKSGQITPEQAKAAREDLSKKSDGEIEALKSQAMDRVKSGNIPKLPQVTGNKAAPVVEVESKSVAVEPALAPASVPTASSATAASPSKSDTAASATQNTDAKLKEALQFIQK